MSDIASSKNPRIKFIKNLRAKKKARDEAKTFVVEGAREITRAINAGCQLSELYACEAYLSSLGSQITQQLGGNFISVESSVFDELVVRAGTDGLLATFAYQPIELKPHLEKANVLVVIVEAVEKPGNLGALLRTADACGVAAIITTETSVDRYNPNVIRASLGTVFSVPCAPMSNENALALCKAYDLAMVGASPDAHHAYHERSYRRKTAVILGNEAVGLSSFWQSQRMAKVKIPMLGVGDSLNLSVSGAVMLYEIQRQANFSST